MAMKDEMTLEQYAEDLKNYGIYITANDVMQFLKQHGYLEPSMIYGIRTSEKSVNNSVLTVEHAVQEGEDEGQTVITSKVYLKRSGVEAVDMVAEISDAYDDGELSHNEKQVITITGEETPIKMVMGLISNIKDLTTYDVDVAIKGEHDE